MDTLIELIKRKKYKTAERVLRSALDKTPKDTYVLIQLEEISQQRSLLDGVRLGGIEIE